MAGQIACRLCMNCSYIEKMEARINAGRYRATVEIELANLPLDADFPDRCRADQNIVLAIFYRRLGATWKVAVAPLPPEKDIGVEQQPHDLGIDPERLAQILG